MRRNLNSMRKEKWFALIIFLVSLISFTLYLFQLRFGYNFNSIFTGYNLNSILVWLAIIGMVGSIIYQILKGTISPKIILAQIFLLSLVAHYISIIPYENGGANQDWRPYLWTTRLIMDNGFTELHNAVRILPYYDFAFAKTMPILAKYPVLFSTAIATHWITTINLETVCHWLPSIWSSTSVIAIYLIAKVVQKEERIALFASLGFATYITFITFHAQYVREGIAFPLMLFSVWAFLKAYRENKWGIAIIAVGFCALTILSHWNVSLMLVGILGIITLGSKISNYLVKSKEHIPWSFVLLIAVALMAHGLFVNIGAPVRIVGETNTIVKQGTVVVEEGKLPSLLPDRHEIPKSVQVSYASWVFGILLALGILWKVIKDYRDKSNQLGFSIATFLWAIIVFTVYWLGLESSRLHPGRVAIFLYPLTIVAIASLTNSQHNRIVRYGSTALITAFVLSGFWRAL